MKNSVSIAIRAVIIVLFVAIIASSTYFFINYKEIVTKNFVLPKIERVLEDNNSEFNSSFVVDSENDQLYNNLASLISASYYYDGVSNVDVTISDENLYKQGHYQCVYVVNEEQDNFDVECEEDSEHIYVNYIVNLKVSYSEDGISKTRYEKGLVVFIKSPSFMDFFTWQLVRLNRVITIPAQ